MINFYLKINYYSYYMDFNNCLDYMSKEHKKLLNEIDLLKAENIKVKMERDVLQDELNGLKKVSMIGNLSKQVDEKNKEIELLNRQITNLKNKNNNKILNIVLEEPEEEELDFEIIEYEEMKLLKDIETRKLYYMNEDGSQGDYAGKQSKKGKIKIKNLN